MDIKLSNKDRKHINHPSDVYEIMQRILQRENKIDKEKEHFWIVGMNWAGYILYIELISLGGVRNTVVEPMNVYRVAVMKSATRVIGVHNHPSGNLEPSEEDKDITDRLIQVGKILNIEFDDHLIISPTSYISFRTMGLMKELEQSIKYVPTYSLIERVRKEEKAIAKEVVKTERERRQKSEQDKKILIMTLLERKVSIEDIAKILDTTPKAVEKIINIKK